MPWPLLLLPGKLILRQGNDGKGKSRKGALPTCTRRFIDNFTGKQTRMFKQDDPQSITALIGFFEQLDEPWGIKDGESRHVYMNSAALHYTSTPSKFDFAGRKDDEFPVAWSEMAQALQEHDRIAENSQRSATVIETHYWYGEQTLKPFLSSKFPIYDAQRQCLGTVWNAREVILVSPLLLINNKRPSVLHTEQSQTLFTKKELELVFFLQQKFSAKEIAQILQISYRTVENRVFSIYQKAGVHSLSQFIEFCKNAGLDNYIPHNFLHKGVVFC